MKAGVKQIEGYAYGAIQPSVVLTFSDYFTGARDFNKKLKQLLEYLPRFEDLQRFFDGDASIDQASTPVAFVTLLDTLNHYCGDQRFTPIRVFEEGASLCFALPTLSTAMTRFNMNAVKHLLDMVGQGTSSANVQSFLEQHKGKARPFLPAGTNAGNFIAAAAERKIPFKIFSQKYVIFGYGSGSRIFNSSITDEESAIGVGLAKSKVDTNRLLKMSGIPVAEQARVRTLEDALSFAEKIGYPVVLKPEAEEQGRGVYANIVDESELKDCWSSLSNQNYKSIIIEQHIFGYIYRINTVEGHVVRVVKRIPALVVGDGRSTIAELLSYLNKEPLRADPNSSMVRLDLDGDVVRTLAKQSYDENSVPPDGKTVYLTSTSSVSRGGHSQDFYEEFHPDNFALCEKTSRVMRLDMTGIDVIAVDASHTWCDGNFVICEVNSQPQLGVSHMHIYDDFITQKIKVKPFIRLVVSSASTSEISLFDPIYDNMEIEISPEIVLRHGCPVQYFDEIEISDDVSDEERKKIERMLVSVQPELVPAIS
jgi:D-alanine-D-alanine ligase-like ATP-grasp enzyme